MNKFKKESPVPIWLTVIMFMIALVMYLPKHDQTVLLFACVMIVATAGFITGRYCDLRR